MATATRQGPDTLEKLAWHLSHHAHSVWDSFSADEQRKMVEDDMTAGASVSLVLGALITAGLVLSAVTLGAILQGG
jgi:hypothetical protein